MPQVPEIFGGDNSRKLWDSINAIEDESAKDAVYFLGCKLQEFESQVRRAWAAPQAAPADALTDEDRKAIEDALAPFNKSTGFTLMDLREAIYRAGLAAGRQAGWNERWAKACDQEYAAPTAEPVDKTPISQGSPVDKIAELQGRLYRLPPPETDRSLPQEAAAALLALQSRVAELTHDGYCPNCNGYMRPATAIRAKGNTDANS